MSKLLFYVKLGPLSAAVLGPLLLGAGCGYQPVFSGTRPSQALSVAASGAAPSPRALDAALAGARAELSLAGVLGPNSAYPSMLVEVLRVDELASGISASPGGVEPRIPAARGSVVAVTARAWVIDSPGAEASRDTGDIRRSARHAVGPGVMEEALANDAAIEAAARLTGRSLARAVLGIPEPGIEPL